MGVGAIGAQQEQAAAQVLKCGTPPAALGLIEAPPRGGQLRGGILSYRGGRCLVRMAEKLELPSCYLVITANKTSYEQEELIEVQLTDTPFGAAPR